MPKAIDLLLALKEEVKNLRGYGEVVELIVTPQGFLRMRSLVEAADNELSAIPWFTIDEEQQRLQVRYQMQPTTRRTDAFDTRNQTYKLVVDHNLRMRDDCILAITAQPGSAETSRYILEWRIP